MKNNQKIPVSILADREVFEYLKEKGDERKTRTEAYCDLLDKSLVGFVSPFLRKKDYVLQPNQCHLTVSDLASEWHWHRATVRSFLSAMEAFGLLTRIQLPKSVVITMTVQSGQAAQPRNAQEQPDFTGQLREVLSDWVIGKTTAAETGTACGQLVSQAMSETADRDTGLCSDTHSNTTSAHSGTWSRNIVKQPCAALPTPPCKKSCTSRDSMTVRRLWISSGLTSVKNGLLSSSLPKTSPG